MATGERSRASCSDAEGLANHLAAAQTLFCQNAIGVQDKLNCLRTARSGLFQSGYKSTTRPGITRGHER